MASTPFDPSLRKKRIFRHGDLTFSSVKALAVRNSSLANEEFGHFEMATDLPRLIPAGEVWISARLVATEGIFFIAHAVARAQAELRGLTDEQAYEKGLEAERLLRERLTGIKF